MGTFVKDRLEGRVVIESAQNFLTVGYAEGGRLVGLLRTFDTSAGTKLVNVTQVDSCVDSKGNLG